MPSEGAFPSGKRSGIALGRKLCSFVKMQDICPKSGHCGSKLDRACIKLSLIFFNVRTD